MLFISNTWIKNRLMGGAQNLGCCSIFGPRSKIRKFTNQNRRHQIPNWGISGSIKRTHVPQFFFKWLKQALCDNGFQYLKSHNVMASYCELVPCSVVLLLVCAIDSFNSPAVRHLLTSWRSTRQTSHFNTHSLIFRNVFHLFLLFRMKLRRSHRCWWNWAFFLRPEMTKQVSANQQHLLLSSINLCRNSPAACTSKEGWKEPKTSR